MMRLRQGLVLATRVGLGAAFLSAGLAKLDAPAPFAASIAALQLVPFAWVDWISATLPIAEILTGAWLITGWRSRAAALAATMLASVFVFAVGQSLARGLPFDCHCFGLASEPPPAWFVLARALALLAVATCLRCEIRPRRTHELDVARGFGEKETPA